MVINDERKSIHFVTFFWGISPEHIDQQSGGILRQYYRPSMSLSFDHPHKQVPQGFLPTLVN
ncbi:MAG: hypothetical protein H0V39_01470, partial [Nitrosomonas sp.]|nr:hypothetical protein [Nitrosomonas sp.]